MNFRKEWLFLLIIALAFALRFIGLSSNPSGLFRDEADKGYTAYCLLETGMDQSGSSWPLFVKAMNVTTSSLYQYVDMPFIAMFGLTEKAVRLPACLAGVLSVVVVYLLASSLWGSTMGLWAGLFICLSPWSILLSRWANQSILLTVSVPLGIYFFLREREREFPSVSHAMLSSLCFLVALYTYAPARLFAPVLCVLIWIASFSKSNLSAENRSQYLKSIIVFFALFAVGCCPLAYHLLFEVKQSAARLSNIWIFDQPLLGAAIEWLKNYMMHLSPGFLFLNGDGNLRHNTNVFGQAHWYIFPLLIAGIVQALRRRSRVDRVLLAWFFCFPIAAACTRESIPHALRSVFAIPVLQVMAAYGIVALYQWKNEISTRISRETIKTCVVVWLIVLILFPLIFQYDLMVRYPKYAAVEWEYGYQDALDWYNQHHSEADKTVVSGLAEYPYVFFLFYGEYSPKQWIKHQRIENVEFYPTGKPVQSVLDKSQGRVLYLLRQEELPIAPSEHLIRLPGGQVIWKWVAWGKSKE
jgi:4-amino-4-deoxy-L-arabinose transferase-like glycosyltransferase